MYIEEGDVVRVRQNGQLVKVTFVNESLSAMCGDPECCGYEREVVSVDAVMESGVPVTLLVHEIEEVDE